jgi:hypothetical protein
MMEDLIQSLHTKDEVIVYLQQMLLDGPTSVHLMDKSHLVGIKLRVPHIYFLVFYVSNECQQYTIHPESPPLCIL